MSKMSMVTMFGVGLMTGAAMVLGMTLVLSLDCGDARAAMLDSVGAQNAEKIMEASEAAKRGTSSTSKDASATSSAMDYVTASEASPSMQNATGGAVISGVGSIPVGASIPDEKMQGEGASQAVATFADTEDVVMRSCTSCHGAAITCAELGKKDASQWAVTVQKMVTLGAELSPSEQADVTQYLAGEAPKSGPLCK